MSDKKNIAILSLGIFLVFSSCNNEPDNTDYLSHGVLDTTIINRDSIRKDACSHAMKDFVEKKIFLYTAVGSDSINLAEGPKIIEQFYKDKMGIEVMPTNMIIDCGNTSYNEEYSVTLYQRWYRWVFDSIAESHLGNQMYLRLKKYCDSTVVAEKVKILLNKN